MRSRFLAGMLIVILSGCFASAGDMPSPEGDEILPKARAEAWADRVRKLTREGWTVSVRGNDIVIERDRPVRFVHAEINAPPVDAGTDRRPPDLQEGTYRLTLRFARKMNIDEYEKLAAVNAVSMKEREQLQAQTQLTRKFDEFLATTPEEEARLKAYREAEAKLAWHDLPDLYTPDHSIYLFQSWSVWSSVYDKDIASECQDVRDSVLRYFGMYDPEAATGRIEPTRQEPQAER